MLEKKMTNWEPAPWRGSSLARHQAFDPFFTFRQEMDRLLDDFIMPGDRGRGAQSGALQPSIELMENDKAYCVCVELPGLEMKDVQVDLSDNVLSISGEKRSEREKNENGVKYSERAFGQFERRIPLEAEIDADKVEAAFKNGVLNVRLPKNPKAQEKTRRIEVKAA
jgi:HSP20 family protein